MGQGLEIIQGPAEARHPDDDEGMTVLVHERHGQSAVSDELVLVCIRQEDVLPLGQLGLQLTETSDEQTDSDAKRLDIDLEPSPN